MKIISLNTWGGKVGKEKLLSFFGEHKNIDIFCLQEVWAAPYTRLNGRLAGGVPLDDGAVMTNARQEIAATLPTHESYFRPHFLDDYGLLMLVRKDFEVIAEGELFVYREKYHVPDDDLGNHARNIQYVTIRTDTGPVTIINFHGLWNGRGKTDSDDRLEQSKKITHFVQSLSGECVLCGDFNLLPDTKSIKIIEEAGLVNLIKTYSVQSTRTSLYTKPEKFADYILVSKGIIVRDFRVLSHEVSDHVPLYLEIG